jgi:hypothetical protein
MGVLRNKWIKAQINPFARERHKVIGLGRDNVRRSASRNASQDFGIVAGVRGVFKPD